MTADAIDMTCVPDAAQLQATDRLLDRLGQRVPAPTDLDTDVVASLALLARAIDRDFAPPTATRRALQGQMGWPPPVVPDTLPLPLGVPGSEPPVQSVVLPRPGFLRVPRPRRGSFRVVPLVASAGAVLTLSMMSAAALTDGRSVNPAVILRPVVDQFTGGSGDRNDQPEPRPTSDKYTQGPNIEQGKSSVASSGSMTPEALMRVSSSSPSGIPSVLPPSKLPPSNAERPQPSSSVTEPPAESSNPEPTPAPTITTSVEVSSPTKTKPSRRPVPKNERTPGS